MRKLLCLVALLLCGCLPAARVEPASYDIGPQAAGTGQAPGLALGAITARAPSWLATPAMQYRLAYAQGSGRHVYADSRWAAPPAELLELALARRILAYAGEAQPAGCRLVIDVDEFIQVFDKPDASHALLEVRAALLAPRGNAVLARHAFSLTQPAGVDAASGVAAFGIATGRLAGDIGGWLHGLAIEAQGVARRCSG